ncbi:hypothetical protein ACSBOB_20910 [Mesorhizobium sp. ASY16-5R]|uniref:hypothetical protein n=1 Tax=Mesorhizobium sp. ASY16-5R TaxID=3445772 RepID=UPI003FA0B65A
MRRLVMLAVLAAMPVLASCATESSGVVYGPPCGISAYEGGHCPYIGYRTPVPLG